MAITLSRRVSAFLVLAAAAEVALTGAATADELQFNNGDRITGKIESIIDGKVKMSGTMAGDLTVNLTDLKTFATDAPIALKLKDQTVVTERVATADAGTIKTVDATTAVAAAPASAAPANAAPARVAPLSADAFASVDDGVGPAGATPAGAPATTQAAAPDETAPGTGSTATAGTSSGTPVAVPGASVNGRVVSITDIQEYNKPPNKWNGTVAAGAVITRGNSKSESISVNADANYRREKDRTTLAAGYAFGRDHNGDTGDSVTSIDNSFASGKYDYFLSPKLYTFALTRLDHDRVADLYLRVSPNVGFGYQWVDRPDLHFSTEAGVGYVWEKFDNDGTDEHIAMRLAYHVDKKLNDKVYAFHNFEYVPSVQDAADFNINTDAGLRVSITQSMFTEFKVEMKYDSQPAPEASDTDVRYLVNVGWSF